MEQLIAHLLLARTLAHINHFATGSYAAHMALGDFYQSIGDAADALAEAYMGAAGRKISVPVLGADASTPITSVLRAHLEYIALQRYIAAPAEWTAIQNLIDEAVSLYNSTLYKLEQLA